MKCPNCNNEIKDGFLLCSVCGKELSYVPTFEAEIEGEMDKALSDVNLALMDTVDLSKHPELAMTKDLSKTTDVTELYEKLGKKSKNNFAINKKLVAVILLLLCVAIVLSLFIRKQLVSNSYDSIMQRAQEYIDEGDYESAIPLFEAATKKAEATNEAFYELANSCYLMGELDHAQEVLENLIIRDPNYRDAYALLITLYEGEAAYDQISKLLSECPDNGIYDEFRQYVAPVPGFSSDEGTYENELTLSILVDTPGKVYYTLDGSEPSVDSLLYKEPIILNEGKWVVRAMFENEYGIRSESISKIYEITNKLPDAPEITPVLDEYNKPEYIYANAKTNQVIFYTTDGSMPDENSFEYIYPVPMKAGENVYKFIAIDEDGSRSDVSTLKYTLNIQPAFNESEAVNYLVNNFTAIGKLADVSGLASNLNGMYQFKCLGLISLNNSDAYLIEEFYMGNDTKEYQSMGNYYAVDCITAAILTVHRNKDGIFIAE